MRAVKEAVFSYRCPSCHCIMEKEQLFAMGCPLCGWTSRLVDSSGARKRLESGYIKAPLLEVFDEARRVVVLAEMPDFAKDEIEVKALNRLLIISAHGSSQRYYRKVMLPSSTTGKTKMKYKNGVLEVTLRKGLYGR